MINCNSDFGEEQNYGSLATPTYKKEFVVKGNPGHVDRQLIKDAFVDNTEAMGVVNTINSQIRRPGTVAPQSRKQQFLGSNRSSNLMSTGYRGNLAKGLPGSNYGR